MSRNAFFEEARRAQVQQEDSARFLQYAQDISTSEEDIPRRLIAIHDQIARTTSTIKKAFGEILQSLIGPDVHREGTLVLLVDDLDLQPQHALELLELIYLLLNRTGIVVVIAADKDLLIHSIDQALRKQHKRARSGLAVALLAKYVPYEWMLPTPNEAQRLRELWGEKDAPHELPHWWPDEAASLYRTDKDTKALAQQLLGPLLPRSYRGLKAVHNRLLSLRDEFGVEKSDEDALFVAIPSDFGELQLATEFIAPMLSMVVAVEVRFPELGLILTLRERAAEFHRVLLCLLSESTQERTRKEIDAQDKRAGTESISAYLLIKDALDGIALAIENHRTPVGPDEFAVFDRLRKPYLKGRRLGEAKQVLLQLARTWRDLVERSSTAPARVRFLTISMMTDALAMAEPLWRAPFTIEEVQAWHIDLRRFVAAGQGTPEELRTARSEALRQLQERRVLGYAGAVELHVKAKLAFVVWLGWELRYLRPVNAYNVYGTERIPFEGPAAPMRFEDVGRYELLRAEPTEVAPERAGEAIVLVDLTGKSKPEQLDRFQRRGEAIHVAPHRYRLIAPVGWRVEPADLIPVLQDVLELLGRLSRDAGVEHVHLAFAGPDVVAFFLGQQLNALGRISLYEFYPGPDRYEFVFDLQEDPAALA